MVQLFSTRRSAASRDLRLSTTAKNVHTRLPREVRDIIYDYLLTSDDIFRIAQCSKVRLDRFPYLRGEEPVEYKTKETAKPGVRPRFIDPERTYVPFAAEVIEVVYERFHGLWIDVPSQIPAFLATDFFDVDCAPRDARLSKLHVSGRLDSGEKTSVDIDTLALDFKALLDCNWGPKFDVDIAFRTELDGEALD
ncbi:hypothetical protein N0V83_006770 [Neocucurbitaria cava]|uniref:Uncharacterized protein n=1 Tax=Neocucurbitaria cava TaxID=798079 RepID=A0A9W8Y608_9PLEO|nr:hypothetical protein N0V83_006770 [Neocucurbitaria cava]